MRIIWSPKSLKSLEEIFTYIFSDNSKAAENLLKKIENKASFLLDNPLLGKPSEMDSEVRELQIVSYQYCDFL